MRALICGARAWTDVKRLRTELDRLDKAMKISEVIVGGAPGADTMAFEWALSRQKQIQVFPAQWQKHGQAAGFIRNVVMLDQKPDVVIGFLCGPSHGTKHTLSNAKERGILTIRFLGDEER